MRTRAIAGLAATVTSVVLMAGTASAAWLVTGSGSATGAATSLSTPAVGGSTALSSSGGNVNWTAPGGWQNNTTYTATASATGHLSKSCSALASAGSCTLAGLDGGTPYALSVVASVGKWASAAGSGDLTTTSSVTLAITGGARNANSGNVNYFTGTSGGTGTVTVTVCASQTFPCASPLTSASTSTSTPGSPWTTGGTTGGALSPGTTTYYAQATQGTATSAVVSFVVPNPKDGTFTVN